MKNLPCIVALSGIFGVVLVTAASFLGLRVPYLFVVSHLVGFSVAAGVLALFLADYAPRKSRGLSPVWAEAKPLAQPAEPARTRQRRAFRPPVRLYGDSAPAEDMTFLNLRYEPATLSRI
jgi:hypothetical protein